MSHLAEYHNQTVTSLHAVEESPSFNDEQGVHYDACSELAIELITSTGAEWGTKDDLGAMVSDDVQTLLTLAMFRLPTLRDRMENLLSETYKS